MRKPKTRKAMIDYLSGHFRYDTMSSWNRSTSYAVRCKLRDIDFPTREVESRAYELLEVEEAFDETRAILSDFDARHDYTWQIGQNGRSGGYFVLYQGGRRLSQYKSRCTRCGQGNCQPATDENNKCGRCNADARVNATMYETYTRPGCSTDQDEDFSEWTTSDLRSRVDVVWDFDKTCAQAIKAFVDFATEYGVCEETVLVEKKVKVACAVE